MTGRRIYKCGMITLAEFLSNRRKEITAQIDALKAELSQIDAAQAAIQPVEGASAPVAPAIGGGLAKLQPVKTLALRALDAHPDGLDTDAIIEVIESRFSRSVPKTSLAPELSRLKADGKVENVEGIWRKII